MDIVIDASDPIGGAQAGHRATRRIDIGESPFVIAEAGVNHNGQLATALELVDRAAAAGADAVKFQTFKAKDLVDADAELADYQRDNLGADSAATQLTMLEGLELEERAFRRIREHCDERGIIFLSSPHTESAIDILDPLVPAYKVGSGDLTHRLLLERIARLGKPIFIGTGMATLEEVVRAEAWLHAAGARDIVFLHCTTNYPCPFDEVNLDAMLTMRDQLQSLVGYSDHTLGTQVPIMAATLGAVVVEKHFTLDRNMPGPDHAASMEPDELAGMIRALADIALIRGDGTKRPTASERAILLRVRKGLVYRSEFAPGHVIGADDLIGKRPLTGVPTDEVDRLLGRRLLRAVERGQRATLEDVDRETDLASDRA